MRVNQCSPAIRQRNCGLRLSARPCLLAHYGIVAELSDDHRTLRQNFNFVRDLGLIGPTVFHHRRASVDWTIQIAHRASAEQDHRDPEGGARPHPASGVGSFSVAPRRPRHHLPTGRGDGHRPDCARHPRRDPPPSSATAIRVTAIRSSNSTKAARQLLPPR